MELSALAAFIGVATTLVIVPGPDWAVVLGAGPRRSLVLPTVSGLAIGYIVITAVVVAGMAPLVAAEPAALTALSVVGGVYLLYVGVGIVRSPNRGVVPTATSSSRDAVHALGRGVGVSALNPKSLLFFLAFLPQFARTSAPWPFAAQLAVLGLTWVAIAATFYFALGFAVQTALTRRPRVTSRLAWISGAAMLLAGSALLAEQVIRAVH